MTSPSAEKPSIDVRVIPPGNRHPMIFDILKSLEPGQGMEITSDHDPRPLHYHLDTQFPGIFGWSYLERGPAVWRVEIERLKSQSCNCGCGGH
ncbi:MAG: DUF2249 domain-containing protein [Proteobacteria bacterium]|nr:DUF2249 domain-containing protein [Pseudomonadota bacterium]